MSPIYLFLEGPENTLKGPVVGQSVTPEPCGEKEVLRGPVQFTYLSVTLGLCLT